MIGKTLPNNLKINSQLTIILIRFYQRYLSPLFLPRCRFFPHCSEYALQAFAKYSWFKAFFLIIKRLGRCHPFCEGGFDPI